MSADSRALLAGRHHQGLTHVFSRRRRRSGGSGRELLYRSSTARSPLPLFPPPRPRAAWDWLRRAQPRRAVRAPARSARARPGNLSDGKSAINARAAAGRPSRTPGRELGFVPCRTPAEDCADGDDSGARVCHRDPRGPGQLRGLQAPAPSPRGAPTRVQGRRCGLRRRLPRGRRFESRPPRCPYSSAVAWESSGRWPCPRVGDRERLLASDGRGEGGPATPPQALDRHGVWRRWPERRRRVASHPRWTSPGSAPAAREAHSPNGRSPESGGYDLNLFASTPDCSFLCSVCHGVLKRPVRLPCSHIFCKKCILRWLTRQKTCPCCRKEVKRKKMVHVNKLRRAIGRLQVKCKNAEAGCLVTCPLAHRRGHQDSCPFELTACPREGCTARVPRGALAEHQRHCQQSSHQLCPLGCGATLGPAERAGHNCYRELRDAWSERQERSRTLLLCLLQRVRQVHRTTNLIRRQLAQLGNFLEEDEALLAGTPQEAAATPEGSGGAGLWRAQSQSAL